jgi:hypothetical protein
MSILPSSLRLSSLAQAVEFFDHRDRSMHDVELLEGAAYVFFHKLGLVLRLSKCGEAIVTAPSSPTTSSDIGLRYNGHFILHTKGTTAYSMTIFLSRHPQGGDQMMSVLVPLAIGGILR